MYDLSDLSYPPDLILKGVDLELKDVKPLVEWNHHDNNNLLNVMKFLKAVYVVCVSLTIYQLLWS
jgi:hypothetical protein